MGADFEINLELDFAKPRDLPPTVSILGRQLKVTPVFYAYWRFAAERQRIFFRRLRGMKDLTADPVLAEYKFTNAYRASDRVSQYLIARVIYRDDLPADATNLFFRILLFKLFNKIETWQLLERSFGQIRWETFDIQRANMVLTEAMQAGDRIYSAAYIMPSPPFGHRSKHCNHLALLARLVETELPQRLCNTKTMQEAYEVLLRAPSLGPFLAYQFVTDLNYSDLLAFTEDQFVVAGPGACDGIQKCFVATNNLSAAELIRYMYEQQEFHFEQQGIRFENLWGRSLQLIDCQNLFCEISKYARVAYPEILGSAGRTRIKQKFSPNSDLARPTYPPKWGLNDAIKELATA